MPKVKKGKEVIPPSLKVMPNGVTEKGKKLWKECFTKYKKQINHPEAVEDKWATAIAIFRNYCLKRNVPPFTESATQVLEDTKKYMENRLTSNRTSVAKKISAILKKLKKTGFLGRIYKEVFDGIDISKTKVLFNTTTKVAISRPTSDKEFKAAILALGFARKPKKYVLNIGIHSLVIEEDESKDYMYLTLQLTFTREHAKHMVSLSEKESANNTKLEKELSKLYKKTLKDHPIIKLATKVKAHVSFHAATPQEVKTINFNEELSDVQKDAISNIVAEASDKETFFLGMQFNIDYVRSLSTPSYQYQLIKALSEFVQSRGDEIPSNWKAALEKPNRYFNPDVYNKIADAVDKVNTF